MLYNNTFFPFDLIISAMDDPRAPKRRKSGIQKRLREAEAEGSPEVQSQLAAFLASQVVWGIFSPQVAQNIADLACKDFDAAAARNGQLVGLRSIASVGNHGKLPNNSHRDFVAVVSQSSKMPQPFEMKVRFEELGEQPQSVILPHLLFASIYEHYKETWASAIASTPQRMKEFWQSQANHPQMENHPILQRPDHQSRCVPIGFHGDEVPLTGKGKVWQKQMLTFEWTSLLSTGSTIGSLFWVWGVFVNSLVSGAGEGLDIFFQVLKWSFHWLFLGKWPSHDWKGVKYTRLSEDGQRAGKPLAGGFYGCLWAVMGDLDYLNKVLGLPHHSANSPCTLCQCQIHGESSWKNNSNSAGWVQTIWSPTSWLQWAGRAACKLFEIPGVTACTVAMDYMHCKYLGVDQYMFGSIFYLLCFVIMDGTPKENLRRCWLIIKKFYKDHGTKHRYRYINRLTMFVRKKDFPKLRGKAAQIKGLAPAMLELWNKFKNPNLEIHNVLASMLNMNVTLDKILDKYKEFDRLPENVAAKFLKCARAMAQCQLQCCEHFLEEPDVKACNITSKTHMLIHSAMLSQYLNPRRVWCFAGEDFMRKVQRIGEACVAGNNASQAGVKMVSHYLLGMHLEFEKQAS